MDITVIVELQNNEVEKMLNAQFVFEKEQINEYIIHTCVSGFENIETNEPLDIDNAMEELFIQLKDQNVIPQNIEDFSYELPSCERIKNTAGVDDVPQRVVISFVDKR